MSYDPVLLQLYAKAKAPLRDYYGITVSRKQVIINIWNISHGPHVFPKRWKLEVSEFRKDRELQSQVEQMFGLHVSNYIIGLAKKEFNLQYLPTKVFLYIIRHLAARDILKLSQTSKMFFEMCNAENVWKIIAEKKVKRRFTKEELRNVEDYGWRNTLRHIVADSIKSKLAKKSFLNQSKSKLINNPVKLVQPPSKSKPRIPLQQKTPATTANSKVVESTASLKDAKKSTKPVLNESKRVRSATTANLLKDPSKLNKKANAPIAIKGTNNLSDSNLKAGVRATSGAIYMRNKK